MNITKIKSAITDNRGTIKDILEDVDIQHATIISFTKHAIRGNHYHKHSVQYTLVLKGCLKLITQLPGHKVENSMVYKDDLIETPPMEKHVMQAVEESEILVLTRGPRGGKNYETDTYRLKDNELLLR